MDGNGDFQLFIYVDIWNHPFERSISKWMAIRFQVLQPSQPDSTCQNVSTVPWARSLYHDHFQANHFQREVSRFPTSSN